MHCSKYSTCVNSFTLTTTLSGGYYYYPYVASKETETQKDQIT